MIPARPFAVTRPAFDMDELQISEMSVTERKPNLRRARAATSVEQATGGDDAVAAELGDQPMRSAAAWPGLIDRFGRRPPDGEPRANRLAAIAAILTHGCPERTYLAFLLEAGRLLIVKGRYVRAYADYPAGFERFPKAMEVP